ncbi:hypothetical protein L3X38_027055 [Prunus dulcis]|uniref:Uncharacterized protein n=1 Tax=Prunus dulcis TaxID=3755 RepID=A0AAD4VM76_PRUDU|nr:hypothetical protein L3X38_027055 [Prunus dulcis]
MYVPHSHQDSRVSPQLQSLHLDLDMPAWKPSCRSFGSCRTMKVEPGSLDIQTPHLTCARSLQRRTSPLPSNKCLMLCAGLDSSNSSECLVVSDPAIGCLGAVLVLC